MRKKLLALLMCATMVLGTAVTTMAATSESDAKKVYGDNADKFIAEYYPTDAILKSTAINGTKTVEYGYLAKDIDFAQKYTPVVLYKAGSTLNDTTKDKTYAATQVLGLYEGAQKKWEDGSSAKTENVSTAAKRVLDEAIAATPTLADGLYAVKLTDDNGNSAATQVVIVSNTAGVAKYEKATEGTVSGTNRWVKAPTASEDELVHASKGILKSTDENGYGTLYSSLNKVDSVTVNDVISAIDGGVFSKDAVAVKVTAYLQGAVASVDLGLETPNLYGGSAKPLYNVDMLQAGKYTFDADLITRTGFKGAEAVNVFQPTYANTKFDTTFGTFVKDFVKVATVKVDDTITFDNAATLVSGVFVFDKGELAAEPEADKNDGVSDTTATTPATDNTASPKTGDVAPIAALAVVMMGAFGAMVVASKKRA